MQAMTPEQILAQLEAARTRGDLPDEIQAQLEAALKRGDVEGQLEILRQSLSLAQQNGNTVAEIEILRQLGNVYQHISQLRKAHAYRVVAAELAADPRSQCPPEERMWVEGDLGRSYLEGHEWQKAEKHTLEALKIAESLGDQRAQDILEVNRAVIYANTGRMDQAQQMTRAVLHRADARQDYYILGLGHMNLASFLLPETSLNGHINECQRHAHKAMAYAELSGDRRVRRGAQRLLGEASRVASLVTGRSEYSADAEEHLQTTIELAQKYADLNLEVAAELEWANLSEDRRQPAEIAKHYQRALDLLETLRGELGYEELQLNYFQSFQRTYERVTEFLLRRQLPAQAFHATERLRSRLLLSLLGPGQSNTRLWTANRQDELMEILNLYGREVLAQCFGTQTQAFSRGMTVGLRGEGVGEEISDALPLREARQRFLHLYDTERGRRTNWYWEQSPPPIEIEEAQKFLGSDDALISYLVTDRSVIIFVATNQTLHFQHLAYSRESIAKDIAELCMAMNTVQKTVLDKFIYPEWNARKQVQDPWPEEVREPMEVMYRHLEKLYVLLIAPVLAAIDHKAHWVIVPHGPLHRLPWAALRSGGHYLIEQHSLSLLPSASIGAVLAARETGTKGEAVFFADPDNRDKLLQLPAAQKEVRASYEVFRTGPPPFRGSTATKDELLKRAPTAKLLHLSCHHLFDARAPFLSFLKLAGKSGADFLYMFEVAELKLAAELVSLSACNSAHSHIASGDEQYGIVRAFLAAGARSVISTLWSVEDESASVFFINFYQRVLRNGSAQALKMAQLDLLADPRYELPNFWAAYVLSGQWNHSLSFSSERDTSYCQEEKEKQ